MLKITPYTRPKEKIAMLSSIAGKLVRIAQIGKSDAYFQYNLIDTIGTVIVDEMYRVVFYCNTNLEAHGLKANVSEIYFTDVQFEELN